MHSRQRLTIHRVVANGVADVLDNALPAAILDVISVRDDESNLSVVILVVPAVQVVTNADVL